MSRTSPRRIALLNLLHERGPMTCLEIERALGAPLMDKEIGKAKQAGQVASCKKVRLQPIKYRLTPEGFEVIRTYIAKQNALAKPAFMDLPPYVPPQWTPARPGAMAAFSLPSRGFSC